MKKISFPVPVSKILIALFLFGLTQVFVAEATTTWTPVVNDSFTRANSSTVGNGWIDSSAIGSISSNTLLITPQADGLKLWNRILRPTSEAVVDQKIDITATLADTNASISHGVILRGKSVILNGIDITPAITVTLRHNGSLSFALAYNGYVDYIGSGITGTTSFTPTIGHSYTMSVSVENNFPITITTIVTDNTSATQVANSIWTYSNGQYGNQDLSTYFKDAGVGGLVFEANTSGQTIAISNVTTYSASQSGTFTVPANWLVTGYDSKMYLATPLPTGGTPPYTIRWYRGVGSFTPPISIDGSGGGTGTFLGTGQEIIDTTAPTGVTNFSNSYRPVFFDSGTNATMGVLGHLDFTNSPSSKPLASPAWIGDSITFGYLTSAGVNGTAKSPGAYTHTILSSDTTITNAWQLKFFNNTSVSTASAPGKTSGDFAVTSLPNLVSFMADRAVNVVNIMLGTNDSKDSVATSTAAYKSNIQTIITALKAVNPNMRIVLNKPIWFKPDTGYGTDFSTASLGRLVGYDSALDQLADGTNIVVGDLDAYNEIQTYGWTGSPGVNNPSNATTSYPPAPTSGKSYLTDGLHPYDGGSEMIAKLEWAPNMKNALLGNFTAAYIPPATSFSLTGPSSGLVSAASTNFTITPNASYTGTVTITPSGGGLSTPIVRTFSSATPQTFTITPTSTGTVTLTPTNNGSLANPSVLTYTVTSSDTTPPARSSAAPSGTLSSGTTSTTISLSTDEAATCRYSTTSNTVYASMTNTFSTTGGASHSTSISTLANGNTYTYYIRCIDNSSNVNIDDYIISFSIANASSFGGHSGYRIVPPLPPPVYIPTNTPCPNGRTPESNCMTAQPRVNTPSINIPVTGIKKISGIENIKNLQIFLNWILGSKITPLVVDGKLGMKTVNATKVYQSMNALNPDGVFGALSAGKAINICRVEACN